MQRIDEQIPPRPHKGETTVSVSVGEDDLLGLQALAAVSGVRERDSGSFAELLKCTLHRGVVESCKTEGLSWPPQPGAPGGGNNLATFDAGRTRERASLRADRQTIRAVAFAVAALVTVVVIVGSYAGHWSWTGLTKNGQVWDWLQVLLLPVALGTIPLWLRFSGQMSPTRRKALKGAVLAFAGFVLAGYVVPLTWTGFRGHTLWDWMTLIILPATVAAATVWPKTRRTFLPAYRVAAGALGMAWIVTLIGGYAADWGWTGYPGNTLWDWVQLLLAPSAITLCVVPELIKLVSGHAPDPAQG